MLTIKFNGGASITATRISESYISIENKMNLNIYYEDSQLSEDNVAKSYDIKDIIAKLNTEAIKSIEVYDEKNELIKTYTGYTELTRVDNSIVTDMGLSSVISLACSL